MENWQIYLKNLTLDHNANFWPDWLKGNPDFPVIDNMLKGNQTTPSFVESLIEGNIYIFI